MVSSEDMEGERERTEVGVEGIEAESEKERDELA